MKSPMERFEEDYMAVEEPCNNKRGFRIKYVYYGPWYAWKLDCNKLKEAKREISRSCIFGFVLFIIAALQYSKVNAAAYTSLFGSLSLGVFLFEAIGVVQFCLTKERFTRPTYKDIEWKLRLATPVHGLLVMATAASSLIESFSAGAGIQEALVVSGYFLSSILFLNIFRKYRTIPYTTKPNDLSGVHDYKSN